MLGGPLIIATSFFYLGLLFAVAYWADRRADQGRSVIAHPTVYALSLAVYCTAWTYYGSVGRAAQSNIGFLPIYIGPTLGAALWVFLLLKMIRVSKSQRITSIADFISSRHGKSHLLGGLVTIIAVVGIVPYIALQLKAVSNSFTILMHYPNITMPSNVTTLPVWQDTALYVALLLALFTILFGTRHLDASERHEGLVAAIAFESIIKLIALTAVGLFVTFGLYHGFADVMQQAQKAGLLKPMFESSSVSKLNWFSFSFLSAMAVLLLPRQFQVAVVENSSERHISRAVWLFPLYLLLINIFVLPIAMAGLLAFPDGSVDADTFVLTLPIAHGQAWLAMLSYLGGLSAATGMVIVETIALSTMVCNDLVMPLLLRHWRTRTAPVDMTSVLLLVRRSAIFGILLLGYTYFRVAGEAYALVSIGLISFAAVAQFAPTMIGGLYWRGGTQAGALAGLGAGFLVWAYTLLLPSFAKSGWLPTSFLEFGPMGINLLTPQALFGLSGFDEITHCLFWSLTANVGAYLIVSLYKPPNAEETAQASLFVDAMKYDRPAVGLWRGNAEVDALKQLASRFLGKAKVNTAFSEFYQKKGTHYDATQPADAETVHFAETLLTGAIGSASARVMVASVAQEEPLGLDEVMNILDEASHIRAHSKALEEKSRELEQATAELRAANTRLKELDQLKDDFMSSVTHELRTPLTSIRAFSEMLHDDPKIHLEDRKRFLSIIVSETERLTRLVNQVLDLASIESGRGEWTTGEVTLSVLILQSIEATEQLFRHKKAIVETDIPINDTPVWADGDRLMQVMLNLLSNAVKFIPANTGKVIVSLTSDHDSYRVSVTDNGPGIARQKHEIIFEKFQQGDDVNGANPMGTGLGLPISRQIIEHFGGRLWVESTPGSGATFHFTIPRALAPIMHHEKQD
ncbi:sensor histidine kinase [Sedimenticola selenatireducens]|uniref:histidine kinase n=1 Tax=Sedimenticola selenatireducens TaxID=191960 RepID=A0A557SHY7_9GAMM|nr:sensor histidine kinase [Sedimenticola selenatireducens]TVO76942.1 histidine kinase [Sedimenticola selenatireducens]TVT64385.1 MAG: histidine kinase [Sedimenticola selenatireducens]